MPRYEIVKRNPDGTYDEVGMNHRYIVTNYASPNTAYRYGVHPEWKKAGVRVINDRNEVVAIFPPTPQ